MEKYFDFLNHAGWLGVAAGAIVLVAYGIAMRRRAMSAFAQRRMLPFLAPQQSGVRSLIRNVARILALALLAIALMGPRWGSQPIDAQKRRLDLIICLDVSKSMLANDAGMPRLDRAKDDIKRLLGELGGANIGLITFAGRSEMVCPLTDDYEYFRLILDEVGIYSAPLGGTNIGEAIKNARVAFGPRLATERAIILMTDGEDHANMALDEARLAKKDEITVYCIGLGDDNRGALVPVNDKNRSEYIIHDQQQVWSKLDPQRLEAIARAGGGDYFKSGQVNNRERTLEWLFDNRLKPSMVADEDSKKIEKLKPQFHWFAIAALGLLAFEFLIPNRRKRDPLPAAADQMIAGTTT